MITIDDRQHIKHNLFQIYILNSQVLFISSIWFHMFYPLVFYVNQLPGFGVMVCYYHTTMHILKVKVGFGGIWRKWRVKLSLTHILYTQSYILSVSPPVVAVPWGATIIQPSVVKTESDVIRTVKQP